MVPDDRPLMLSEKAPVEPIDWVAVSWVRLPEVVPHSKETLAEL